MNAIWIDLGDGFEDDEVMVSLVGAFTLRLASLTTDLRTGQAGSIELQLPNIPQTEETETSEWRLQVEVSNRALSAEILLTPTDTPFTRIMLGQNQIRIEQSPTAFLYF